MKRTPESPSTPQPGCLEPVPDAKNESSDWGQSVADSLNKAVLAKLATTPQPTVASATAGSVAGEQTSASVNVAAASAPQEPPDLDLKNWGLGIADSLNKAVLANLSKASGKTTNSI